MQKNACNFSATYYKKISNKRIVIVGLVPPPFGGISVHIKRVDAALVRDNTVTVIDVLKEGEKRSKIGYACFLIKKLLLVRPHVVYYHTLSMRSGFAELVLLLVILKLLRAQFVLVEHSGRFLYKRSILYKYVFNHLTRFIDEQVLIGQPMLKSYLDNKIAIRRNFIVENAFVEPNINDESRIFKNYPLILKNFIACQEQLLLMNASKFGFWDGRDIYGFDLCLRLMKDLRDHNMKMIMIVANIYDQHHYERIRSEISEFENVFLLVNFQCELWPIMRHVDLFVRPSRFDNTSLSVAEALWVKTPVVASDVAPRPQGTILFKTGDYGDFKQKVLAVMNYKRCTRENQRHYPNTQ